VIADAGIDEPCRGESFAKQACGQQSGGGTASEVVILNFKYQVTQQSTDTSRMIDLLRFKRADRRPGPGEDVEEKPQRRFHLMEKMSSLGRESKEVPK
jgi:hypothetical protein